MTDSSRIRIGADVGGTFTDVILLGRDGAIHTLKVPSTPPDFEKGVLRAVELLLESAEVSGGDVSDVAHGTTVATNAVLQHRGANTSLITTRGFRDVLELRRIRAPQNYDLFFDKPPQLIERSRRLELTERMSASGEELIPIDVSELRALTERLERDKVDSVAVCLLHSYAYPQHERQVGEFLHANLPGADVSLSCDILPERKEYERTATTVVNAYVRPVMRTYLESMRTGLGQLGIDAPLLIMQSAGGLTPEDDAALRPVFALESGPAAGVLAAKQMAQSIGIGNVITLDMGGTTAKAALIEEGQLSYCPEYEVGAAISSGGGLLGGAGELIRAPSIDISEVGAGGGSIAYLDNAGGLRVGPSSAGAVPGPVCYGQGGTEATLTDANVALGFIRAGELADGQVSIDFEAACRCVQDQIASPLGLSLLEAAEGIHRIANARTMRALRAVSTERGRDPRDFVLIAFGGAGPIHAAGLGRELAIRKILVPTFPGLFSALGLLSSGVEHHHVHSCMLWGEDIRAEPLEQMRSTGETELLQQFGREGFAAAEVELTCSVDVRFKGQTSEIRIPLHLDGPISSQTIPAIEDSFETEHERQYGHRSDPDNPMEITALRLVGRARSVDSLGYHVAQGVAPTEAATGSRLAYFGSEWGRVEASVVGRSDLSDSPLDGPLLIDEYDTTIVIPPGTSARVDDGGNIAMEVGGSD